VTCTDFVDHAAEVLERDPSGLWLSERADRRPLKVLGSADGNEVDVNVDRDTGLRPAGKSPAKQLGNEQQILKHIGLKRL